jgi:hypothetical protein
MDLKSLFYTIFKTLNPNNHQSLSETKFSTVLKYYFFIIFFSVILMSLLFIPRIYSANTNLDVGVKNFDNLNLSYDFSIKTSFNILSDPVIKFDSVKSNSTSEAVVITPENIYYKRFLFFGQYKIVSLEKNIDIVTSESARNFISMGLIFILPALFFWSIIVSIIYFSVVILVTYLVVITLASMLRINVSLLRLLKMCIYSSTLFIILQLVLMPFFSILMLPLILYWLLVVIILFLWQDSMYKNRSSGDTKRDTKSVSKNIWGSKKNIFDDSSDMSARSSSSKIPIRESYDVDENGNLKGSSRKHKSFDSDDGYVELK